MVDEKFKGKYGKSENKNFFVIDSVCVPHPYCIGTKLVAHASDNFSGMLGDAAIKSAEEKGIFCETCEAIKRKDSSFKILSYDEHKQALVVSCKKDIKLDDVDKKEAHEYLLKCKPIAEKNGYVGFVFLDNFSKGKEK